jgi:hypothetical protein
MNSARWRIHIVFVAHDTGLVRLPRAEGMSVEAYVSAVVDI